MMRSTARRPELLCLCWQPHAAAGAACGQSLREGESDEEHRHAPS